jgi:hypothetical protein
VMTALAKDPDAATERVIFDWLTHLPAYRLFMLPM